jgi:hypothetical protein
MEESAGILREGLDRLRELRARAGNLRVDGDRTSGRSSTPSTSPSR